MEAQKEALLIGVGELSELLGLGRSSIYRHLDAGKLPEPIRIGGSVRWRKAEIEAWVSAGCPARNRWEWEGE